LERGQIGEEIGVLDRLEHFQNLELIDFELKVGFGAGFVKLQMLKKVLLIPAYKDEVQCKPLNVITDNVIIRLM
jgi:hypothetical protein